MQALQIEHISKSFNHFKAVDDVSFSLDEGKMFALLGPNGAGKTTTMRMIMNIIVPDAGSIRIFGEPFRESHKNLLGYLPEERGLYPKMKVLDHLQFLGEMKGLSGAEAKKLAREWLERFDLAERAQKKVMELSKGLQQKVQFIGTMLHSPRLLIVDEPFSGLDPVNTKFMKDVLLEMKKEGKTIILSTHMMEQAEKLCDEICLINKGKAVLQGNLDEIKQAYSQNSVTVEYRGNAAAVQNLPLVESLNDYGNYMEIRLRDGARPGELFRLLAESELEIQRFEAAKTSLNEIFIQAVKD
ncbi:MAG: ATP-binding cassette domain-containing protein [Calditrichaeota bacterium]|nr:ATP-binding cassette domain-containing protein [Calditrichota bacterium]MCB0296897.1 ATP-binding cassette domain-containing protein [Calditrichota bacterium]MCB0304958.1 ATP-binding cassette domain-containing protein [Calditrichota bacterium]MCB9089492.1 ATP-binding cassette domain-containing protein [Calditrichia bacterium]